MSKGETTKNQIIDESAKLFAKKGYISVTMKDICEATSLSRGGLYRYFGSTKEIFIAMLQKNIDDSIYSVKKNIDNGVPAIKIFNYFLKIEKESILSAYNGLFFAIHEFAFYEKDQKHYFDNRLNTTLKIIVSHPTE